MDLTKFRKNPYFGHDKSFSSNRDNNGEYICSKPSKPKDGHYNHGSVRVPSLKRSNATWKKFYKLFPELKGQSYYLYGNDELSRQNESFIPLKKI